MKYLFLFALLTACGGNRVCSNQPDYGKWQVSFTTVCPGCSNSYGTMEFYSKTYYQETCAEGCKCETDFLNDDASCSTRTIKQTCDNGNSEFICKLNKFSLNNASGNCIYLGHGSRCDYTLTMEKALF